MRADGKAGEGLFVRASSDKTRPNGLKLTEGRFRLDMWRKGHGRAHSSSGKMTMTMQFVVRLFSELIFLECFNLLLLCMHFMDKYLPVRV